MLIGGPSDMYLAFYKGRATNPVHRFHDWAIRTATNGDYSHVELVLSSEAPEDGGTYTCVSSSGRDNGVRKKDIQFAAGKWDYLHCPWTPEGAAAFTYNHMGQPYDYTAIVLNHMLSLNRHSPDKWTCSELIGSALGFDRSWRISPNDLFSVVSHANLLYTGGSS